MRKRFVVAAFCIFTLPLVFAPVPSENLSNSPAFATVALAGHNVIGGKCACGDGGCTCDPGEHPPGNAATSSSPDGVNQGAAPSVDPASGILALALIALLWFRLR